MKDLGGDVRGDEVLEEARLPERVLKLRDNDLRGEKRSSASLLMSSVFAVLKTVFIIEIFSTDSSAIAFASATAAISCD